MKDIVEIVIASQDGTTRATLRFNHGDATRLAAQIRAAMKTAEGSNANLNAIASAIESADDWNTQSPHNIHLGSH